MSDRALSRGLPGGIALSRLRVYDWPAADGTRGGSPHLHTASTEGYLVLAGKGSVQTLSAQGFEVTPLAPGTVAWFTPGTVHRLINDDGELEILTLMSNAGLPEAGDAVLTFPADIVTDPAEYAARAALPSVGTSNELAAAARRRRDLALRGFADLVERASADLEGTLAQLYAASTALVTGRVESWRDIVSSGPAAQTDATWRQLDALAAGRAGELHDSGIRAASLDGRERFGMCGILTTWESIS